MDSYNNKNRITRQTESKGRQTTNSSSVFKQKPLFGNADKLSKKKYNNVTDKSNNNSPETKKVSQTNIALIKHEKVLEKDELVTQLQTAKKSNVTNIKSRLAAYTTLPSHRNDDNDSVISNTLSSSSNDSILTNTYLGSKREVVESKTPEDEKILVKKEDLDNDNKNDKINEDLQNKSPPKINIFVYDEQNNNNSMKDGHFNMLHTYVRDDLFKKIKILADSHLELNGFIMKKCLEKSEYDPSKHGAKFINECRSEIRKTMNSRRGYVKRKITNLMIGKLDVQLLLKYFNVFDFAT